MGGGGDYYDRRVTKFSPLTNTWTNVPSLQEGRYYEHSVCVLDDKIFVLGGGGGSDPTCEMLDLSDDDPKWRYIADMNSGHTGGAAVVIERKIFVVAGSSSSVEIYDLDQGKSNG